MPAVFHTRAPPLPPTRRHQEGQGSGPPHRHVAADDDQAGEREERGEREEGSAPPNPPRTNPTTSPLPPPQHLADIKGLSEAKIDKLLDAARTLASGFSWTTARAVEAARARDVLRVSTGAAAVDAILGGGIETKCITEVYGEYRTGKTQMVHTLCVTCQLPPGQGGAAGKVR